MANDVSQLMDKLGEHADAAADEAEERVHRARLAAQEAARAAAARSQAAWEAAQRAGAQVRAAAGEAYARSERGVKDLARRVEQRPVAALLAAAALGYAMAYVIHARR